MNAEPEEFVPQLKFRERPNTQDKAYFLLRVLLSDKPLTKAQHIGTFNILLTLSQLPKALEAMDSRGHRGQRNWAPVARQVVFGALSFFGPWEVRRTSDPKTVEYGIPHRPLTVEQREWISKIFWRLFHTPKALKAFDGHGKRGKRKLSPDRALRKALAVQFQLDLDNSKAEAVATVAKDWACEPGTVSDAYRDHGEEAKRIVERLNRGWSPAVRRKAIQDAAADIRRDQHLQSFREAVGYQLKTGKL